MEAYLIKILEKLENIDSRLAAVEHHAKYPTSSLLPHFDYQDQVQKCIDEDKYGELTRFGRFYIGTMRNAYKISQDLITFEHVLQHAVNINESYWDEYSLAEYACYYGDTKVVNMLIQYKADFTKGRNNAFTEAIKNNHIDIVEKLIKSGLLLNVKCQSFLQKSLLMAFEIGNNDIINIIVKELRANHQSLLPKKFLKLDIQLVEHYLKIKVHPEDLLRVVHAPEFILEQGTRTLEILMNNGLNINYIRNDRSLVHILFKLQKRNINIERIVLPLLDYMIKCKIKLNNFTGKLNIYTYAVKYFGTNMLKKVIAKLRQIEGLVVDNHSLITVALEGKELGKILEVVTSKEILDNIDIVWKYIHDNYRKDWSSAHQIFEFIGKFHNFNVGAKDKFNCRLCCCYGNSMDERENFVVEMDYFDFYNASLTQHVMKNHPVNIKFFEQVNVSLSQGKTHENVSSESTDSSE